MSAQPSTSRERIIPIQIEGEDSTMEVKEKESLPHCPLDESFSPYSDETREEVSESFLNSVSLKKTLPICNAPEKIILVVDSAEDENFTPFKVDNAQPSKPLDMLKRAIEIFLHAKHAINKKHEYALAVLNENSVVWLVNFTNNINEILNALQGVNSCETEDILELNSLFDVILQNVSVPSLKEVEGEILPPPYVVHALLLYGRSYTMPKLLETDEIDELLKSPYFTLDVLMTHEPVDDDNNCNKIFNVLQRLDQKGYGYFFSVARDAKTLFNSMGKLLGHPLQRPAPKLADYSVREQ